MESGKWKRAEEVAGSSASVVDASKREIPENPNEPFHDDVKDEEEEEEEVEEVEEVETEEDVDDRQNGTFVPGPLLPLKDQIEMDKEDESLRRWKEKLLGFLDSDFDGIDSVDPEVKFHSIGMISEDCGEIVIPLPLDENQNGRILFTLREGSHYQLKLTFSVLHNIVSGLKYSNTVRKGGIKVDHSKEMLGTFAPKKEPYVHSLNEEITPSGVFARGVYSAKVKFEDDDKRCHMELKYSFEIKKKR